MSLPFTRQTRLYTPGPTPVPDFVRAALLDTETYHRAEPFYAALKDCRRMLAPFFGAKKEEPLILSSSGTGAMEAAMVNLTAPGDKIVCVNAGKFGERWEKLGKAYGCQVETLTVPWGQSVTKDALLAAAAAHPDAKAFFLQANETSTGVAHPLAAILPALRAKTEALLVVDAISGLVAHEVKMDEWGVDAVVSGSQKGFGVPPGLAFIALSERAWSRLSSRPRFYFDLARERKEQQTGATAWTPAINLVLALRAALTRLEPVGPAAAAAHHARLAQACQAGVRALELRPFAQSHPSHALTAVALPEGMDGSALVRAMRQRFNVVVAGGQDHMKGKMVRLSHLGFTDDLDLVAGLAALEFGLKTVGHAFRLGAGVTAAMEALA